MKKALQTNKNKKLCERYPFLKWYGNPLFPGYDEDTVDYSGTWEDELSDGWKKAFCPQMWEELRAILERANYVDSFRFTQIKEKWGLLTIYYGDVPEEIFDDVEEWASKYENLSEHVCINCGKPATYMTLGWITYICEDCANENHCVCVDKKDLSKYFDASAEEKSSLIKKF